MWGLRRNRVVRIMTLSCAMAVATATGASSVGAYDFNLAGMNVTLDDRYLVEPGGGSCAQYPYTWRNVSGRPIQFARFLIPENQGFAVLQYDEIANIDPPYFGGGTTYRPTTSGTGVLELCSTPGSVLRLSVQTTFEDRYEVVKSPQIAIPLTPLSSVPVLQAVPQTCAGVPAASPNTCSGPMFMRLQGPAFGKLNLEYSGTYLFLKRVYSNKKKNKKSREIPIPYGARTIADFGYDDVWFPISWLPPGRYKLRASNPGNSSTRCLVLFPWLCRTSNTPSAYANTLFDWNGSTVTQLTPLTVTDN